MVQQQVQGADRTQTEPDPEAGVAPVAAQATEQVEVQEGQQQVRVQEVAEQQAAQQVVQQVMGWAAAACAGCGVRKLFDGGA